MYNMMFKKTIKENQKKKKNQPNAKKKVKIAEKIFPIIAETAKWHASLTLSTKFPKKDDEEGARWDGYAIKSIVLVGNYTKNKSFV